MSSQVVRMTDADVDRVAPMLVRAFDADPLFEWIEPRPGPRAAFVGAFMRGLAWRSHLFAEAFRTAPDLDGVSLWKGPDLGRLSEDQLARCGLDRVAPLLDADARARFEAAGVVEDVLETRVPLPRWYLGVLGVDPARQSRGWGALLMKPHPGPRRRGRARGLAGDDARGQRRVLPAARLRGGAGARAAGWRADLLGDEEAASVLTDGDDLSVALLVHPAQAQDARSGRRPRALRWAADRRLPP